MVTLSSLKRPLRPARSLALALVGFLYDWYRFARHGGWRASPTGIASDYKAVKIYHRLEKSLSFKERNPKSGIGAARDLIHFMESQPAVRDGYHHAVGVKVLNDFAATAELSERDARIVHGFLGRTPLSGKSSEGGVVEITATDLLGGRLESPEQFFLTRHSVRDFKPDPVSDELLDRALSLALKTPSVCNRQAWHVYRLTTRERIDRALSLQNGNRGFGNSIPVLLIVTADLRAFDTHGERYQHWIDGGMFSMGLVMALHSLGLASCCLNWSKGVRDDLRVRQVVQIDDAHTILMMIAVGHPSEALRVCYSARRPLGSFITDIV